MARAFSDDADENGVVRQGGRVRVKMMAMDSAGETLRRYTLDATISDAAAHRPGFRMSSSNAQAMVDAAYATRAASRDARELAYKQYTQDLIQAWKTDAIPAEELLRKARRSAELSGPMRGNSDPDDPLYKRFRREQSAAPFVERSPSDPGGEPDDADPCPLCGRTGGWRTCEGEEDDDNDSDETDRIVRRTQTEHEGTRRMDVPDRQAVLDAYRAYDLELARAWVGKND